MEITNYLNCRLSLQVFITLSQYAPMMMTRNDKPIATLRLLSITVCLELITRAGGDMRTKQDCFDHCPPTSTAACNHWV